MQFQLMKDIRWAVIQNQPKVYDEKERLQCTSSDAISPMKTRDKNRSPIFQLS